MTEISYSDIAESIGPEIKRNADERVTLNHAIDVVSAELGLSQKESRVAVMNHTEQEFGGDGDGPYVTLKGPVGDFNADAEGEVVNVSQDAVDELQEIEGVGRKTAKQFITAGHSTKYGVGNLDLDELVEFDGIGSATALTIQQNFDEPVDGDDSGDDSTPDDWSGSESMNAETVDRETGSPTEKTVKGSLPVRDDDGHPMIPTGIDYVERQSAGNVTDAEELAFKAADADYGVVVTGPPGVGKGRLVRYLGQEANIPVARVNFGARVTKERLIGGYVPKNGDSSLKNELERARQMADGESELSVESALEHLGIREKFHWRDGLLTLAVRNGWWFLADEINAAAAENLMPFFGLLEDSGTATLEIPERSEVIEPHDGFRFISTRNPTSFEGVKRMNNALLDRMYKMQVDYLPERKEVDLLQNRTGLSLNDAQKLVNLANNIRASFDQGDFQSKTVTFRMLERIGRMAGDLWSLEAATRDELITHEVEEYGEETGEHSLDRRIENVFSN